MIKNHSNWAIAFLLFTSFIFGACQKDLYVLENSETVSTKDVSSVAKWYDSQLIKTKPDTGFASHNTPNWNKMKVSRTGDTRVFTAPVFTDGVARREVIVSLTDNVYSGVVKVYQKSGQYLTTVHTYSINGKPIEEGYLNATNNYHVTKTWKKDLMGSNLRVMGIGDENDGGENNPTFDLGPLGNDDPDNGAVMPDDDGEVNANNLPYFVYTGKVILFYDVSTTTPSVTYYATSGLAYSGNDYRNSAYQNLADRGPIPEGLYSVNLTLDPDREAQRQDPGGVLYSNYGIQKISQTWTSPSTGATYSYSSWGTKRARLRVISGGNGRDNFYIHNSHKGYSHGCIEVINSIFDKLLALRKAGKQSVGVRVKYSGTNVSTHGLTYY